VFFIPWRVVAENSGAAHFDLLGPALRLLTDVADSTLVIFRLGATMEVGRSERPSYRVDGADRPAQTVDAASTLRRTGLTIILSSRGKLLITPSIDLLVCTSFEIGPRARLPPLHAKAGPFA
jgi:hypothetical protein